MPRQLPWLNRGSGSRTQVKQPPKPAQKARIQNDIDVDFFEGTALASSRKGKEGAASRESDDDLFELSNARGRTTRIEKEAAPRSRLPSSSPPLSATLPLPQIESMRKGVDKFDLRDDEWMMVEDELLQTAKMFTRHLHLAEYERMKAEMEERAKQATTRPVVPDAKPSDEGRFKQKAKDQTRTQKKTIKDIFTATSDDEEEGERAKVQHTDPHTATSTTSTPRPDFAIQRSKNIYKSASDSDDLDVPRHPTKQYVVADKVESSVSEADLQPAPPDFVKPALPLNARARAKLRRPTPFDMWDDFVPKRPSSPPKSATSTTPHPPSTAKVRASTTKPTSSFTSTSPASSTLPSPRTEPPARSLDLFSDLGFPKRDRLSKETSDRLAKRKAEKEKEKEAPNKSRKSIDDIPTFLF